MSVIVPTSADRAPRLRSALASIWAQEGVGVQFDMEVIVVDDASWGPTEEVVRRFPGTRHARHDVSRGVSAARNTGLAESTGKYVAFLDDDDLWLPHRLSVQVPELEQAQRLEVVYSQFVHVHPGEASKVVPSDRPSGWITEAMLAHVSTILIPRATFDQVGEFDESLWWVEDTDMWMRLALQFPFRYVPGVVSLYVGSSKERTDASIEGWTHQWLITRDKILTLIQDAPNEAELRRVVLIETGGHIVPLLLAGSKFAEARRTYLQALEEVPVLESDWYRLRVRHLTLALAFACVSNKETRSLFAEVKQTAGRRGLRRRLKMRAFLADLWTGVALHHASGRRRNDRLAGAAAARAILQNPLKPLSRPGLLRLAARPIAPFGRGPTAQRVPSRLPQVVPSGSHPDDAPSAHVLGSGDHSRTGSLTSRDEGT